MLTEILKNRGFKLTKKTATEFSSPCPFCGGEDRFIIWPEENRAHCIRGCGWKGDNIQLLRDLDDMSFQEAAEACGRGDKIKTPSKVERPPKKSKEPFVHPELGRPDKIYRYEDEARKPQFCVCRFEGRGKDGQKTFSQCRPDGLSWTVKGIRLVLYHLSEIKGHEDIAFCEGEKDCDAVRELGFPSTCNPGGAGKLPKQQEEHKILDPLTGKRVFIFAHNDEPGRKHAEEAANLLHGKAKEIRIVNLPDLQEAGDAYDFIQKHGRQAKTKLTEEIFNAPIWVPPKAYYSLQELCDLPDDNHVPIISDGIFPHNSHILIAGESGVGKSLLRLELALHFAMGWDWMGFKIPRARTVAIFQYENSEDTEKYRIKKMLAGLGTTTEAVGDRIRYAKRDERYNLTLKGDRVRLLERVKALGCEIIIYDCLSNLHTQNENDNVKMREVLDILTDINAELGTACIVIHHFGKPGETFTENFYRIRGASSIMDWAYTVLTFTRKAHEEKTLRKVEFVKVRDGRQPKPFVVERDPETFLCRYFDDGALVSPALVRTILEDEFNGTVDNQRDLVNAVMAKAQCSDRTAKEAIRQTVHYKQISETGSGGRGQRKGYRIPMGTVAE
jgi:KaiC/GvpD/RAD55 family RecA-like ATPase